MIKRLNASDAILLLFAIGLIILFAFRANARDNGQWAANSQTVQHWFQSLMQPDNPGHSCCGEADAYEVDVFEIEGDHYIAIITDGHGAIPNGTRISVPNSKIKWDQGNPTGHGFIFLSVIVDATIPKPGYTYVIVENGFGRILYCFVAPTGI